MHPHPTGRCCFKATDPPSQTALTETVVLITKGSHEGSSSEIHACWPGRHLSYEKLYSRQQWSAEIFSIIFRKKSKSTQKQLRYRIFIEMWQCEFVGIIGNFATFHRKCAELKIQLLYGLKSEMYYTCCVYMYIIVWMWTRVPLVCCWVIWRLTACLRLIRCTNLKEEFAANRSYLLRRCRVTPIRDIFKFPSWFW